MTIETYKQQEKSTLKDLVGCVRLFKNVSWAGS